MPLPENTGDLTLESSDRVLAICGALIGCGAYVLHGSNARPALWRLEPRHANDSGKRSGNYVAVYASVDVDAVLMHAVLDREYLSRCLNSYTIGYRVSCGIRTFKVTDNLYRLFKQKDPQLCSDGYVYAMDKACFVRLPDSNSEFITVQSLAPLRTLKVAASLGAYLFRIDTPEGNDTVIPYSLEEMRVIDAHKARLERRQQGTVAG